METRKAGENLLNLIQLSKVETVKSETLSPKCEVRNTTDFGLHTSDFDLYPEPESNRHEIALIGF